MFIYFLGQFIYLFWEGRVGAEKESWAVSTILWGSHNSVSVEPDVGLKHTNRDIMTWVKDAQQSEAH